MLELRAYQRRAADQVRHLEKRGQFRTCLESPTGSGKTIIMADLLRDARRQYVITHRCVLMDQLMQVLTENGLPYGVVASGHKPVPKAPIQLCMWQSLLRRPQGFLEPANRLHIDEIHCMGGEKCLGLFEGFVEDGASIVGYTATPANVSKSVDSVFRVASVRELIDQGHLCQPVTFGCSQPDLRKLEALKRDSNGEFTPQSVNKLVSPHYIFGHVLEQYHRLSPDGRPFVLFAHSVKASIWWAQHLTANGVPTAHIDGDDVWDDGKFVQSDSGARAEVFAKLESGKLKGVSNRFVLREGWNAPFIGHAILTCPFGTRKTFVQACGRVLRPFEGRSYCIIQDHSGSSIYLPPLDSSEEWDWDSPPGRAERIRISRLRNNPDAESIEEMLDDDEPREPIVCPKCTAERYSGSVCPHCGHHYTKRSRYVHQTNGQLELIEGRAYRPRKPKPAPTDAALWDRMFKAAKRNKPNRTPEQIYCWYARQNGWRWLSRDLPGMPKDEATWFQPVRNILKSDLIPE